MSPGVRPRSPSGTFLHAIGVKQRRHILPEHRPEGAHGRREAERAAGLGVHVRHGQRQVGRDQAEGRGAHAEGDPRAGITREACGRKDGEVVEELESMRLGAAARTVRDGFAETLAYTEFPPEHWRRIRTNNGIERINREIRRRTRVVGTFPDGNSALMLVTARLKHIVEHEWGKRRYLDMSKLVEMSELRGKAEG